MKGSGAETRWRDCRLSPMQGDDRGWNKTKPNKILVDLAFPNKGGGMSVG